MADSFLMQCRQNYFDGITPSNKQGYLKEGYKKIVFFAKQYFEKGEYEEFAACFVEGQYLIPLWAAHMLIEYGNPNKELLQASIDIIKEYSDNPLVPKVAEEERSWLNANAVKYSEYI